MVALFISAADGCDCGIARNTKVGEVGPDRVSNVARREMRVMLLSYPRIGVAELRSDHTHEHAMHCECRSVRMAKNMKCNGR
jgi:hypothetical protein